MASRRKEFFPEVTDEQWNDWHWQVKNRIETLDQLLTSSMRTPKPIIKQWCDPLMTFHKHCSCYSLLTLR